MLENLEKYLATSSYSNYRAENLTDLGLAHWHFRLIGSDKISSGKIIRIPKQSQINLPPLENLIYQKNCYQTTFASGTTPQFYELIHPNRYLKNGALIVEEIRGREVNVKEDFLKMAEALVKLHSLSTDEKNPVIWQPSRPIEAMLKEVAEQMTYLERSPLGRQVSHLIVNEFKKVNRKIAELHFQSIPLALISFDCHPGNFIVNEKNQAILVDLEKCRYSYPGFDLAHATLYTSTTWGKNQQELAQNLLDDKEMIAFYEKWLQSMPRDYALKSLPSLLILRTLMWLWSVSWCGKWLIESKLKKDQAKKQNWSSELSHKALIEQVRFNVEDCLKEENIIKVRSEWSEGSSLSRLLEGF